MIAQQVGALQLRPRPGAKVVRLDEACGIFAGKLSAAQAAGDTQKAQTINQEGSARITSKFNGASCPNVKAPTS